MSKVMLQLDTLSCPSCLQKIETGIKGQKGVNQVKVLFNASKVKTEFDESVISAEQLTDVVTKLGYEVKSMQVSAI